MGQVDGADSRVQLREFLEERWKGVRPVLWGDQLREHEFIGEIYMGILNLDKAR
jgi:glycerol-3-phosphate dehydrogenase